MTQISKLEESIKRLEGDAAQARGRALHLESSVRVKERELERLNRSLEATRASQAETASAQLQAEELVRKLDGDLAQTQTKVNAGAWSCYGMHIMQRCTGRQWHLHISHHLASIPASPGGFALLAVQVSQLQNQLKAKDKELAAMQRQLEQARAEAQDVSSRQLSTDEAARKLDGDAGGVRARCGRAGCFGHAVHAAGWSLLLTTACT